MSSPCPFEKQVNIDLKYDRQRAVETSWGGTIPAQNGKQASGKSGNLLQHSVWSFPSANNAYCLPFTKRQT